MYLGIDFSGGAASWRQRCSRPSVWIATLEVEGQSVPSLTNLRPVQDLPGVGAPFNRLVALLHGGDFAAAAIDAPFAIPAEHLPGNDLAELLARVAALPVAEDRPFPSGASLVELASRVARLRQAKPLRATERVWAARGVNTRSTLWNGPRGGAPFAAACLALLARTDGPIWPWSRGRGMLVEAFPAAQLRAWGLPHRSYGKPEQREMRGRIVDGIADRVRIPPEQRERMLDSADALDAVLAAFAAVAADRVELPADPPADGLIAVLDDATRVSAPLPTAEPTILFASAPSAAGGEVFEELLRRPGVRIERIVSRGHVTPPDELYLQRWDEWVMVLSGEARLVLGCADERRLAAGEHLLIPAGVPHRVVYTADPTIWLALHFG